MKLIHVNLFKIKTIKFTYGTQSIQIPRQSTSVLYDVYGHSLATYIFKSVYSKYHYGQPKIFTTRKKLTSLAFHRTAVERDNNLKSKKSLTFPS